MKKFTSLDQIKELAGKLMYENSLIGNGQYWTFKFDNAKRRFGCCSYNRLIRCQGTISLSKPLCLANMNDVQRIKDVILHEIAHALEHVRYGGSSHGYRWQQICIEIGANPKRCFNASEVNVIEGKYKYICPNCNKVSHAHRQWKRTKACGDCCNKYNGGKFDSRFILKPSLHNLK